MQRRSPLTALVATVTFAATLVPVFAAGTLPESVVAPHPARASSPALVKGYGSLPLQFEQNAGQTDARVKFLTRSGGSTLFLTGSDAVLCLMKPVGPAKAFDPRNPLGLNHRDPKAALEARLHPTPQKMMESVVRMNAVGSNPNAAVVGLAELPGKVNYFIGNDPKKWHTSIATYRKVEYRDLYKNIDLAYYGDAGRLEYDFIVRPGGDPGKIALSFTGAKSMRLASTGDLVLATGCGDVTWRKPVVYQERDGQRTPVSGSYVALGNGRVSFAVARYDASLPLVIDPVLVYSTYLGGLATEFYPAITADQSGDAYVAGTTSATNFPVTLNAFQTIYGSTNSEVFITKLNVDGTAIAYSTFLGGSGPSSTIGENSASGVAVDSVGDAFVTGCTRTSNFPVTPNAFQSINKVQGQGVEVTSFVTRLNPTGSALMYSTYLGGTNNDVSSCITLDGDGNAYVGGNSMSVDFPTTPGALQQISFGGNVGFVSKINSTGTALVYSTYISGAIPNSAGVVTGIVVDVERSAYITGAVGTPNFPVTPGAYQTTFVNSPQYSDATHAFIAKLSTDGSQFTYSTFLAGDGSDYGTGIAIDGSGSAYVVGETSSENLIATAGSFQTVRPAQETSYVAKVSPSGNALEYCSYLGGSRYDAATGIAVDSNGDAVVTERATSLDFPVTANAIDTRVNVNLMNVSFSELDPSGSRLIYSGFPSYGYSSGICIADNGAYIAAETGGPATPNAYQVTEDDNAFDNFIIKLNLSDDNVPPPAISSISPKSALTGTLVNIYGSHLSGTYYVLFNKSSASFRFLSDTHITAIVPNSATTGTVSVTTPSGTASTTNFTVLPPNPTTLVLSSTANPSALGQKVSIKATVIGIGPTPTGLVTFDIDGDTYPAVALVGGSAVLNSAIVTPYLESGGTDTIMARYSGDGANMSTNASPYLQVVSAAPTTTQITSSLNPSTYGQTVDYTATVSSSGQTPHGLVIFYVDGVARTTVALHGGSATYSKAFLPSGRHDISVFYKGSPGYGQSYASVEQVIYATSVSVNSFSPVAAPPTADITITGSGFTGATAVAFNGVATTFSVINDSEIWAAVPSGASTGSISVTVPSGTAVAPTPFTVTVPYSRVIIRHYVLKKATAYMVPDE